LEVNIVSINLNCEKCGKKIKAPDDAGGKFGSCPKCGNKCYIPLPLPEGEKELTLAPLDDDSEMTHDEMMRQTHDLTENILNETAVPDDDKSHRGHVVATEKEILKHIIIWVRQMVAGQLEPAGATAEKLKEHSAMTKDIISRMRRAQSPESELADISPSLLTGLMKQLYSQL
jgi:hypothetical protein